MDEHRQDGKIGPDFRGTWSTSFPSSVRRGAACDKRPIFGPPGAKRAEACAEYKTEDMVDVVSKLCQTEGCDKRPSFGPPGAKRAEACAEHKTEDMVDVVTLVS